MTYVDLDTLHSPTAGTRPPAAWGAAVNDNFDYVYDQVLAKLGVWVSYTPTLTQGVAVGKTVTYARYLKLGRLVIVQVYLSITGTGSANNVIEVGLPPFNAVSNNIPGGAWHWYDASANLNYTGVSFTRSSTVMAGLLPSSGVLLGQTNTVGPPNQLANSDALTMSLTYESTT